MMIAKKETNSYWELIVSTQDGAQKYLSFDTKEGAEKYCIDNGWEPLGITKVVFCEKTSFEGPLIERTTYFGRWGRSIAYFKLLPDGEAIYNRETGEWERIRDGFSDLARIYYQVFGPKLILPLLPKSRLIFTYINDSPWYRYQPYIYSPEAIEYIRNNGNKRIINVEYYPQYDEFTEVLRISEYGEYKSVGPYAIIAKSIINGWISWDTKWSIDYVSPFSCVTGHITSRMAAEFYNAFKGKTPCLSIEDGEVNEVYFQPDISRTKKRSKRKLPTPIFKSKD